jgi:hypothetical protein
VCVFVCVCVRVLMFDSRLNVVITNILVYLKIDVPLSIRCCRPDDDHIQPRQLIPLEGGGGGGGTGGDGGVMLSLCDGLRLCAMQTQCCVGVSLPMLRKTVPVIRTTVPVLCGDILVFCNAA